MGRQRSTGKKGCELWDNCLTCPLPVCAYDMPNVNKPALKIRIKAIKLAEDGYTAEQIAEMLGRSLRQIQRYLEGVKFETNNQ
ncbi:helix-turn-helix domain-containing protein [Patescibacteria group bacterium]|uniref:Putative DNA binding, helix-turn-helix domain containing protein n=1 Tax=viral metagenome TaxID=1070528 RepID=A0A6M3MC54_9ZZZZ|nr:helix-turn-helix domain-containing protein [Patescibacteria group bacterium]